MWGYFTDRILEPSTGCGETVDEKNAFLSKAAESGIVIAEEISNPRLPDKTVTACRLNRQNDLVKQILRQN